MLGVDSEEVRMAEKVKVVEYFYALVGDKPGEARRLLEHISEGGVNLVAYLSFPAGEGRSQLDFFPEDSSQLKTAAEQAGIALVGPKRAFLIYGDDRVGALHDHHLKLANANINVHAAQGVVIPGGRYGYVLWVKPDDFRKAAEALIGHETIGHHGTLEPGKLDW
jgi:hypothetical protein